MSITIEDVARRANLNKSSVSRILNGKGAGYSPETRRRVLETANELGYCANALSRALWTGRTQIVGMWLMSDDYYSPYFGYLQHCLQSEGIKHQYQLLTDAVPVPNGGHARNSKLLNWPVDGLIASYMTRSTTDCLGLLTKKECPVVCLQASRPKSAERSPNMDFVLVDVHSGAIQAIEHLLQSQCERIAFVGEEHMYQHDPRGQAYRALMAKAGRKCEFVDAPEATRTCGYQKFEAHAVKFGCPDGIFCLNDELAIGCYLAMQKLGVRVPQDALLVGFDGLENARLFPCPISSVSVPVEKMCALVWNTLVERIGDPTLPPRQISVDTNLVIRASSQR